MQNSQMTPVNLQEDEVKQLHLDISSHVTTLDRNIKDEKNSYIVMQCKIDRWEDKKRGAERYTILFIG